jgi:hypothetical protein
MSILALDETFAEANLVGAIVWWSLKGPTDLVDFQEGLDAHGLPVDWAPLPPRMETVATRAAASAARDKRQLVRPLKDRGSSDFVSERVLDAGEPSERLEYTAHVRVSVKTEGGTKHVLVTPTTADDTALAQQIAGAVGLYTGLLTPNDMSLWLLWVLNTKVCAVSLRDRGGFYFIPSGEPLALWKRIAHVIQTVSNHVCQSIPAVRTEDAVEAILTAVRREADESISALETWLLSDDVSKRGLVARVKELGHLQAKLTRYGTILGTAMPDLEDRAVTVMGALVATKATRARGKALT